MRIGIMLRAIDEQGGIGVYTRNVVAELLRRDAGHDYVLFYRAGSRPGRFADHPNVRERFLAGRSKALWDQVAVPLACRRERVDVLFHPKFTAPLLAPCPVVMTVHGADWFIPDQARYYRPLDVRYVRAFLPRYIRKCAAVISVSQLTTDQFNQLLGLPPGKVRTVYFAPARHFRPVRDPAELQRVKERYSLPDRFIFTLAKPGDGGRKNLNQTLRAYGRYHATADSPYKLVVGGWNGQRLRSAYNLPAGGFGRDVRSPGWLEQEDLPAIYSLATLYLYPSNLEAFPIPLTEAMACGTPIITSGANGLAEIAGDAAVLVDPQDTRAIALAIGRVLADEGLRARLTARGLARASCFSWDRCAAETMAILEAAAGRPRRHAG